MIFATLNASSQNYSSLELVENKGQWDAQVKFKGSLANGAFFLQPQGYKILLNNPKDLEAISDLYHGHTHKKDSAQNNAKLAAPQPDKVILRSHAYEMKFMGGAANAQIIPEKPLNTYNNYFIGDDPSKWASNCKVYQAVTYKNVYPGIDVRYYTDNGQLKYDIIVHPGANPEKIALEFKGTEGLQVKNDNLVIKTSVHEVKELKPYSFQAGSVGKKEISNKYEVNGNVVKFRLGNYDKTKTLVIDPTLVFSTFTGSTADNWGYTATYDAAGNFYGGGIVFNSGFPTNTGTFQTTFGGGVSEGEIQGYDIGIIKFSPDGTNRIYATYIGGSGNEQPHSLVVDNQGQLVIAGRSSSANYPTNLPLYGPGGGTYDICITKLNAAGNGIIGSRKFGGSGNDGVNIQAKYTNEPYDPSGSVSLRRNYGDDSRSEVIVDGAGNIYLASSTQPPLDNNGNPTAPFNFPTTGNAFQTTPGGGRQDGVFIKTSSDLSTVITSSYIGGNGDDAAFVLAFHPLNSNVYIAGGTTSTNLLGTTNGPVIAASYNGGGADGYISIINNNGTSLVKTTYLGTSNIDIIYGIQFDKYGFPYVMGTSQGTAAWPIINAPFSQTNGKQFIGKLQQDLSAFVYSTVFGKGVASGIPDISPVAFLVDRCENVYVSGWGGSINSSQGYINGQSTQGLTVTSNAVQSNTDGSDFYYFVLARDATSQLYGSFFGALQGELGDHVDGGTSRFDRNGVIYQAQCGFCNGGPNPFPTTPGAWAPTKPNSATCNLAAVKIAFELAGVTTGVRSSVEGVPRTKGCVPFTVDFTDTLALGQQYIWNFGDGSAEVTTTTPTVSHTYNAIGTYTIRLVAIDSASCNITDTAYTSVQVRIDEARLSFTKQKLPPCENLTYQFTNTSTPPAAPGKPFDNQTFRWHFGDGTTQIAGMGSVTHTYPAFGTYVVRLELIDTNYCNYPDQLIDTLRISDLVDARFTTPASGCVPHTAEFTNTSVGGESFLWEFGDGNTSTADNPIYTYTTPGVYIVKLTATDPATCNIVDSAFFTVTVSAIPVAGYTYSPNPPKENTDVVFTNNSVGGTSYLWKFGDGDSLFTVRQDTTVRHAYNATGTFNTCLIVYNQFGCTDTICQPIQAIVVPAMDVPNAFTPNNDGINDKVFVRGFGIAKMSWKIYNRWGQLVFSTTNRNEGWDGTFKGKLQAQDVYHFTLDLEFSDGVKLTRTGDITLLR